MTRCVAFLRAINVGNRRVTKDRLIEPFEALGYTEVSTYIASGNVLFTTSARSTAKVESAIEAALADALGFEVPTFVRTRADVESVLGLAPFGSVPDDETHLVTFLRDAPSKAEADAVAALGTDYDTLLVDGRELHQHMKGRQSDSLVDPKLLLRALGGRLGTARKTTMLAKVAALL